MKVATFYTTFTLSVFMFACILPAPSTFAEDPPAEIDAAAVLEAVRAAQRPTGHRRIDWRIESVDPVYSARPGAVVPENLRHVRSCTAWLSGKSSRVEIEQEITSDDSATQPRIKVSVFHEGEYREVETDRNGVEATISAVDQNEYLFDQRLFLNVVPLHRPEALKAYDLQLRSLSGGTAVLECRNPSGTRYVLTVDRTRGDHIVEAKALRDDDSLAFRVEYDLKQFGEAGWYISRAKQWRWFRRGTSEPRLDYVVEVASIAPVPEFPADTFKLIVPDGATITDTRSSVPEVW